MLVDDRLEVFDKCKTFENCGKLVSRQATIVEENTVHMLVIDKVTGFCDALTQSIAESIVLQAKRLHINLLKYRKE